MQIDQSKKFKESVKVIIKTLGIDKDINIDSQVIAEYLLNNLYALEIFIRNTSRDSINSIH